MPRGRSTFTKRQKEQARQQKQRDKNERKTQRKEDKPEGVVVDEAEEMREMRELAEAQAALFRIGSEDDEEPGSGPLPLPLAIEGLERNAALADAPDRNAPASPVLNSRQI